MENKSNLSTLNVSELYDQASTEQRRQTVCSPARISTMLPMIRISIM